MDEKCLINKGNTDLRRVIGGVVYILCRRCVEPLVCQHWFWQGVVQLFTHLALRTFSHCKSHE